MLRVLPSAVRRVERRAFLMRGASLGAWRFCLKKPSGFRGMSYLVPSGPIAITLSFDCRCCWTCCLASDDRGRLTLPLLMLMLLVLGEIVEILRNFPVSARLCGDFNAKDAKRLINALLIGQWSLVA